MNVDELTAALHEEAGEMDARTGPQLTHVHARVHRVRRKRAATVGLVGGLALAAAAAVLAVALPHDGAGPEPAAPPPLVFPQRMGHYHLIKVRTGEPGDGRITMTLPKPSRAFGFAAACSGPERQLDTRLVVNGAAVGGVFCTPDPPALNGQPSPSFTSSDLRKDGVAVRQHRFVLSLTLLRGRHHNAVPTTDPDTSLGLAVYERDH